MSPFIKFPATINHYTARTIWRIQKQYCTVCSPNIKNMKFTHMVSITLSPSQYALWFAAAHFQKLAICTVRQYHAHLHALTFMSPDFFSCGYSTRAFLERQRFFLFNRCCSGANMEKICLRQASTVHAAGM